MNEELYKLIDSLADELFAIHQLLADRMYDLKKDQSYCCNDYFHCPYRYGCVYASQCKLDSTIYEDKDK